MDIPIFEKLNERKEKSHITYGKRLKGKLKLKNKLISIRNDHFDGSFYLKKTEYSQI
jgi:hypothetical protein